MSSGVRVPGRQLRVELRRSVALPAAALAAVLLVLLLRVRADEWSSGLTGLAMTFRNDLSVLLPLALGAGAWQGGRERRASMEELTAATPRPLWARVLVPSSAIVIALLGPLSVALAAALVLGGEGQWLGQGWPFAVLAVSLLAVAAAVLLGTGLGRAVRSDLLAPLSVVGLFIALLAFTAVDQIDSWTRLLAITAEPAFSDIRQARPAATAGQAVWLVGLLGTGALLASASRARHRALAVGPALAGLALAVPLLTAAGGAAYADDPVAAQLVCAQGTPQVCLTQVHADSLPAATVAARRVLTALQALPDPPTRAVEQARVLPPFPPAADGVLEISLPAVSINRDRLSDDEIVRAFAEGFGERYCYPTSPPGGLRSEITARWTAGAWLLGASESMTVDAATDEELRRLLARPRAEQVEVMTDVRAALRACDRDPLALLR